MFPISATNSYNFILLDLVVNLILLNNVLKRIINPLLSFLFAVFHICLFLLYTNVISGATMTQVVRHWSTTLGGGGWLPVLPFSGHMLTIPWTLCTCDGFFTRISISILVIVTKMFTVISIITVLFIYFNFKMLYQELLHSYSACFLSSLDLSLSFTSSCFKSTCFLSILDSVNSESVPQGKKSIVLIHLGWL